MRWSSRREHISEEFDRISSLRSGIEFIEGWVLSADLFERHLRVGREWGAGQETDGLELVLEEIQGMLYLRRLRL